MSQPDPTDVLFRQTIDQAESFVDALADALGYQHGPAALQTALHAAQSSWRGIAAGPDTPAIRWLAVGVVKWTVTREVAPWTPERRLEHVRGVLAHARVGTELVPFGSSIRAAIRGYYDGTYDRDTIERFFGQPLDRADPPKDFVRALD